MRTVINAIHPSTVRLDFCHESLVYCLYLLCTEDAPADWRLVGDQYHVERHQRQTNQRVKDAREEMDFFPTLHIVVTVLVDYAITVEEYGC